MKGLSKFQPHALWSGGQTSLSFGLGRVFWFLLNHLYYLFGIASSTETREYDCTPLSIVTLLPVHMSRMNTRFVPTWSLGYNSNVVRHIPHSHSSLSMIRGGTTISPSTASFDTAIHHTLHKTFKHIYTHYRRSQAIGWCLLIVWDVENPFHRLERTTERYSHQSDQNARFPGRGW